MLGILWHVVFVTGFFQLTSYFLKVHRCCFYDWTVFHCMEPSHSIVSVHQLMDSEVKFSYFCEQLSGIFAHRFFEDLCFHFCQQSFNPEWWGDHREWKRQMREREKLRETFHSHTVTQRHGRHKKREMMKALDAMIRTQTDSLGDKHLETERLSKSAETHSTDGERRTYSLRPWSFLLCSLGFPIPPGNLAQGWEEKPCLQNPWEVRTGCDSRKLDFQLIQKLPYGFPTLVKSVLKHPARSPPLVSRGVESGPWTIRGHGVRDAALTGVEHP